MKRFFRITAVFFILFIIAFAVLFVMFPKKEYSEKEKRTLQKMPSLTVNALSDGSFMSDMENYLSDHFPYRDRFMSIKTSVLTALNRRESEGVYRCSGDLLIEKFTAPSEEKVNEQVNAINSFTEKYKDIKTWFLLAPTAFSIEKESLPAHSADESENRYIDSLTSRITNAEIVDVRNLFTEKHKETELYYRTDHHWTTGGAFLAYTLLQNKMNLPAVTFESGKVCDNFMGSLTSKSGYSVKNPDSIEVFLPKEEVLLTVLYSDTNKRTATLFDLEKLGSDDPYQIFFGGNHPLLTIDTDVDTERKLLVIKDSYANALIPFLVPSFSEISVVDPRYYYENIDSLMAKGYTDILFVYNAITLSEDNSLPTVLTGE